MTMFSRRNQDYATVDPRAAAQSDKVGFLEAFKVGYEEQTRASASFGLENEMANLEAEQLRKLRQAGVKDPPFLARDEHTGVGAYAPAGVLDDEYITAARFYAEGGSPETADRLRNYDERVKELRQSYPDLELMTAEEMFTDVRDKAREYDRRANEDNRTLSGSVGAFVGAAAGAFNPASDPFNVATASVGGAGRSVATRILGQAGAQSVIEGINQVTGVQEQRRLFGLSHGPLDAAMRVGGAAVFGAAFQGLGEGVAAAGRRWFRSTPSDTAPAPVEPTRPARRAEPGPELEPGPAQPRTPSATDYASLLAVQAPYGTGRAAQARAKLDLESVTRQLDDWYGPSPSRVNPYAGTSLSRDAGEVTFGRVKGKVDEFIRDSSIERKARKIDPETMRKYDELKGFARELRASLDEWKGAGRAELDAHVEAEQVKIDALVAKAETQTGRRAGRTRKQAADARLELNRFIEERLNQVDDRHARRDRRALARVDEELRDIAPLVARAVNGARQSWQNGAKQRQALEKQIRDASGFERTDAAPEELPFLSRLAQEPPPVRHAGAAPEPEAQRQAAADMATKQLEAATDIMRADVARLVAAKDEADTTLTLPDGNTVHLDNDVLVVPDENGNPIEMTPRQLLKESEEAEFEIQAVQTCSVRKTS